MTDPVFFAPADRLADLSGGQTLQLDGAEARHAVTVRRLRSGEPLELVDGHGTRVCCEFLRGEKETMTLRVTGVRHEPQPETRFVLVQALAKGDRDLQAAESATELGVDTIIPWQAERSVVRIKPERAAKTLAKWQSTVTAAAKQSRRARWPHLSEHVTSDSLTRTITESVDTTWFVLHEAAARTWGRSGPVQLAGASTIAVIVGPEGGISDRELQQFVAAGAQPLKLGPEVMRASTAGPAALAALCALTGRWS